MKPTDLQHILDESDKHYRSLDALTSSKIKEFVKSPLLYRMRRLGIWPRATTSAAMRIGTLVHAATLEPMRFAASIRTDAPINPKTGNPYGADTKAASAWAEEVELQGGFASTPDERAAIETMAASVHAVCAEHGIPLFENGATDDAVAESTLRGTMDTIGLVQCRPDLWDMHRNTIYDLKTCSDVDNFKWSVRDFRYDLQAAWYMLLAEEYMGLPQNWEWIVVETQAPYRARIYTASAMIDSARMELRQILSNLIESTETNNWATDAQPTRQELD